MKNKKYLIICSLIFLTTAFSVTSCGGNSSKDSINNNKSENNIENSSQISESNNENKNTNLKENEDTENKNRNEETTSNNLIKSGGNTLETRIEVPDGYKRVEACDGSLGEFIRSYPLKDADEPLLLYNGKKKFNQSSGAAVFSLPLEDMDLQQCADSVMRVYAEYFWENKEYNKIRFHFTNGFLCEYTKWRDGYRVKIDGNNVTWSKEASYDDSYENFVSYLHMVFNYAGTLSMESYETKEISLDDMTIGDVIIKGGSPGHVVLVIDECKNSDGKSAYLLGQGYMPAQEFHVITNPLHGDDPWYYEDEISFPFETAEYEFEDESMIRKLIY